MLELAYVVAVLFFVLWLTNLRNPAQVIHKYKDLQRQIDTEERSLEMALREHWEPKTIASIRQRLADLEQRRSAMENA